MTIVVEDREPAPEARSDTRVVLVTAVLAAVIATTWVVDRRRQRDVEARTRARLASPLSAAA